MKWLVILAIICITSAAYGAFTLPQSNSSPNPAYSRTKTLGTKGFACISTMQRDAVKCKTATAAGVGTVAKWSFNADETVVYPASEDTITTEKNKINSVCFRPYSSATSLNATCWGW